MVSYQSTLAIWPLVFQHGIDNDMVMSKFFKQKHVWLFILFLEPTLKGKEPQPQEPSRVFSLLPNYTLKRQYVDIDERTLGMLLKEVTDELRRRLTGQPEGVGVSDARRRTTRFADFEFTGWRLGISNFISTCDGSSHSPTVPTCWSRETNLPLLPSQLWKHRGSADPGLADIFVASNGHQNTEPAAEYRSMSTAEYYNRAAAYKK
ncbi:uncharacterized protein BYT42DRAFT_542155 [Radiomyces spectabilis]|uniref:uncharacterized protein n=1 Tax=Radiomyces spectabilis TaxID=64574 RepID=UPI002220AC10|nr:uncharacterized protein BYT42DRAFT_542155 [Radiomyces spectabilis]KAI8393974.1 hypothetical protein BYT42DRAFT_542155 [Radiomyces spectabilis]